MNGGKQRPNKGGDLLVQSVVNDRVENLIFELLKELGVDVNKEDLRGTPVRVAKMFTEILDGYNEPPEITTFKNENGYDQIIADFPISFYSLCSHHMLPFFGEVYIGYLPGSEMVDEIAGLSKLDRIVDHFAHRLTKQEDLTQDVAKFLEEKVHPLGVMVIVKGRHLCKEMRGVNKQGTIMVTSAIRGAFRKDPSMKAEFLALISGGR